MKLPGLVLGWVNLQLKRMADRQHFQQKWKTGPEVVHNPRPQLIRIALDIVAEAGAILQCVWCLGVGPHPELGVGSVLLDVFS